ncbi:MAG: NAD(P)/FAD-dependent oxidoreductase, partial [Chitinophagaceae bacterium]
MSVPDFKPSYDVAIIGAGVAGLTAAAILAKAGLSICVLEKEPHPGGYLAGFRRKDFRFDTAIHWLNQFGEDGMVTHTFKLLGDDFPKAKNQKRIRRFLGEGFDYLLTDNPDDLKRQWQAEFPEDFAGIEKFFKAARRLAKAFREFRDVFRSGETMPFLERLGSKHKLGKFALAFLPFIRYSGEKGLKKGLAKYFTAPKFSKIFASDSELLSCLIPIAWAYNKDFQLPPVGGGQRIPEWLEHVAEFHGAHIGYQCKVDKVLVTHKTCTGLAFSRQSKNYKIDAKYIIAACDIELLYERMLPQEVIPQKLKDKLRNAELYSSSVTLSIGLDCCPSELGFNEEFIQIAGKPSYHKDTTSHDPETAEISILAPSLRDPSLAPDGKGTL